MTFLAPTAAVVAGALAAPVLLAYYLLKLRRRPLRVSSTLLWTQAVSDLQVNAPFRWLRLTPMFLLHALLVALVVLAIGRPALNLPADLPPRVVILIDRSASMAAKDAGTARDGTARSRLDVARERAEQLARTLTRTEGCEAMVVTFAARPRALSGFTRSGSILADAIRSITPTDQPGDLAAALRLVESLIATWADADESGDPPRTRVVLFSDGGGVPAAELSLAGADAQFERVGPAAAPGNNVGIVSFAARRDFREPALLRVFVRLLNTAPAAAVVPLSASLDGEPRGALVVEVPGATPAPHTPERSAAPPSDPRTPAADSLVPGEATGVFELRTREGGMLTVAAVREDALDADNAVSVVIHPVVAPVVVHAVPRDEAGGRTPQSVGGFAWLVADVLGELGAAALRIIGEDELHTLAPGGVNAGADLVVLDRVTPTELPACATLSLGAVPPIPGLRAVAPSPDAPAAEQSGTHVLSWDRAHPLLRDISLDSVFIARALALATPSADVTPTPAGAPWSITELARGRDGPLILLAERAGRRHAVVAFEPAQSTWPLDPGFAIFLANALDTLPARSATTPPTPWRTVQSVEIPVRATGDRVPVTGPIAFDAPLSTLEDGVKIARIGLVERAGVYAVQGSDASVPFAVNLLDPGESSLGSARVVRIGGRDVEARAGGSEPREIWTWCLVAAAVLLGVEWIVYTRRAQA